MLEFEQGFNHNSRALRLSVLAAAVIMPLTA